MILSAIDAAAGCLGDSCYTVGGGGDGIPFWGGQATDSYKYLLALHILSVIVAFGPTLVFPLLTAAARSTGGETGQLLAGFQSKLSKRLFLPGLIASAFFGVLLVIDSSNVYDMSKPWISAAFTVVIALALIMWFVLRPAQAHLIENLGKGEEGARGVRDARVRIGVSTGLIHLGLLALIVLMIWRPGQ